MDALAGAVVAVLIARRMWLSWCVRERNGYINLQKRDCGTPKFAPQPYWRRFNRQSVLGTATRTATGLCVWLCANGETT